MSARGHLGPPDLEPETPEGRARGWVTQRLGLASALIWSVLTAIVFVTVIQPAGLSPWEMVATSLVTLLPAGAPWLLYRPLLARRRAAAGLPPARSSRE